VEPTGAIIADYRHLFLVARLLIKPTFVSLRSAAAAPTPSISGTKRIIKDAGEFILPDGTRVEADERGGFRLPKGEHVAALADGLLLPNGVQCPADGAGAYVCP